MPYLYHIDTTNLTLFFEGEALIQIERGADPTYIALQPSASLNFTIYAIPLEYESFDFLDDVMDLVAPILLVFTFPFLFWEASKRRLWAAFGFVVSGAVFMLTGTISTAGGLIVMALGGVLTAYFIKREGIEIGL
jgi:hypothetical protein